MSPRIAFAIMAVMLFGVAALVAYSGAITS